MLSWGGPIRRHVPRTSSVLFVTLWYEGKVVVSGALGESEVCVRHGILGWVGVRTSAILFDGTVDFVVQKEFF